MADIFHWTGVDVVVTLTRQAGGQSGHISARSVRDQRRSEISQLLGKVNLSLAKTESLPDLDTKQSQE